MTRPDSKELEVLLKLELQAGSMGKRHAYPEGNRLGLLSKAKELGFSLQEIAEITRLYAAESD